jgi:hypothetical protein
MADADRRIRWLRTALGVALILHALGHASAVVDTGTAISGFNSVDTADRAESSLRFASMLSAAAITCLLAAGLGALNVRAFARRWTVLATTGLLISLVFLFLFQPATMLAGAGVGVVLLFLIYRAMHTHVLQQQAPRDAKASLVRRAARFAWLLALTGMALSLTLRPVLLRWNTRPREAYFDLPGDTRAPGRGFQILHAINIDAAPEQVWPWLAQIGHDRGGFYSYAWLENLFGLHIVNAERINPAWQTRAIGELVPSTPHNWLGLLDRPLGWRVTRFEPGRLLYLENWGAFALVRTGPASTRMYIRTQGDAAQASLWWSPVELFVFEPAHFIMQRKMLLGIKERAERSAREQRDTPSTAIEEEN